MPGPTCQKAAPLIVMYPEGYSILGGEKALFSLRTPIVGSGSCQMHVLRRILLGTATALTLAALTACDTPGVTLVDPDIVTGPDSVTFHVGLEDIVLAQALGWADGVPGAEVTLQRIHDRYKPDTLYTDSAGNAHITGHLPGLYKIAGLRVLGEHETEPTAGVVRAFGDGFKQTVGKSGTVSLVLATDRQGSLVVSDVYFGGLTHANDYFWARFTELYNNSDTTIYLDGTLWGSSFAYSYSARLTCEENEPFREDPQGLWSLEFHQFPGSGRDHPVAPGEVVVIALDALDHSQVDPTLPDLTHADFELEGGADPDNPDVPNMPPRGPSSHPWGHGMQLAASGVMFLALPVDVTTLETKVHILGRRYTRIPTELLVDVRSGRMDTPSSDPGLYTSTYQCANWVNREFDRLESAVVWYSDDSNKNSLRRRILRSVAGRTILQDVNTSRVDFLKREYSPGRIEY